MTQIEQIKAEIERLLNSFPKPHGEVLPIDQNAYNLLGDLKLFIESLPAEQPSEDLEKAATALTNEIVGELNLGDYTDHSGHNAHWHSFKDGVVAGVQWQKQQTLKGLCYETEVYRDEEGDGIDTPIESWLALENNEITNLPNIGLKDGDKVKVIIVKEDEQCSTE